jgi:uncharacterized membrane protein YhiD involved in acid resistance
MAAGAAKYETACFSTVLVLVALLVLGQVEEVFNLKPVSMSYEVMAAAPKTPDSLLADINGALAQAGLTMQTVHIGRTDTNHTRVQFIVEGYRSQHEKLTAKLKEVPNITAVAASTLAERD